ncbi:MAG: RNA polymerase subunit sigma-24 [Ignavibacteria bacterium RIFOXYC2_FULL_35_21]|nr:MAG: RNA polymerase subunit sigma-24 [Ignavibacteria bacterium RIFOXYC2_FULL_35_21]
MKNLKNGNDESFRIIVDKYQRLILNSCYRFVYNRETAEDLTQEVFIEVYRSINMFRNDSKLSTWIYRIAISKSLDYLKSRKRKKRFANSKSLFENEDMIGSTSLKDEIQAPDEQSPEKLLDNDDRIKVLSLALDCLPENQRIAFTLSKYDEFSYKEIADVLGITISSVESLIHRAKVNLRKKLYNFYREYL